MSHGPSMECPNCGRSIAQGEMYCYFCELDIGKMKRQHAHGRDNCHGGHFGSEGHEKHKNSDEKKPFFSRISSKLMAKKHAENTNPKEKSGKQ